MLKVLLPLMILAGAALAIGKFTPVGEMIKEAMRGKANIPDYVHGPDDTGPRPAPVGAPTGGGGPGGGGGGGGGSVDRALDISSMGQAGRTLKQHFDDINAAIEDVSTEAEAEGLVADVNDVASQLDELGLDKMAGLPRATSKLMFAEFKTKVDASVNGIKDAKIKALVKPAVDGLTTKLASFSN